MRHITLLARPELRLLRVKSNRRIIPVNPNAVIAAAFKAAGLPVPELPTTRPGVAPGPIIAAAFRAAGLVPR